MKTTNIIKTLFMNNLANAPALVHLIEENDDLFQSFNEEAEDMIGQRFNRDTLAEISLNCLLISHDTSEILELCEAFKQIKAGGEDR